MIKQLINLSRKVKREFFLDLGDYRKSIILAGTGRSGTTWIQDCINYDNSFRIMFEPFHCRKIARVKHWNYRQYLRPDNRDNSFIRPAADILNGNIRNPWIDQFSNKAFYTKRLIKDIRANLLLKWFKVNFAEIPIILLIRNPLAVANSKLKLGWNTHLSDILMQDELVSDFLMPIKHSIKKADTLLERHVFLWCIENIVPLRQFNKGELLVTFYENLCVNPRSEIIRILNFLNMQIPPDGSINFTKPSLLCRVDSAVQTGGDLLREWYYSFTDSEKSRAYEILKMFDLYLIYRDDLVPNVDSDNVLDLFTL